MLRRRPIPLVSLLAALAPCVSAAQAVAAPLAIGDSFTLASLALGEQRRINVYTPPRSGEAAAAPLPVLYMPDGGIGEDFLHVAGLVQVLVGNGSMRPFLLVGIENTERRRDMTGPTANAEDRRIAPRVGGSQSFRRFLREELVPAIRARYRTAGESAIVGESLAGLFVVETFLLEPDLFDAYLAFDPSLWWNDEALLTGAKGLLQRSRDLRKTVYLASSAQKELADLAGRFAKALESDAGPRIRWHYEPMPGEQHQTLYHPAALKAFRELFKATPAAP